MSLKYWTTWRCKVLYGFQISLKYWTTCRCKVLYGYQMPLKSWTTCRCKVLHSYKMSLKYWATCRCKVFHCSNQHVSTTACNMRFYAVIKWHLSAEPPVYARLYTILNDTYNVFTEQHVSVRFSTVLNDTCTEQPIDVKFYTLIK